VRRATRTDGRDRTRAPAPAGGGPPPAATREVWHQPAATVAADLGTDPVRGLASGVATERLAASGPNELAEAPPTPVWRQVLGQFANTMIVVLLVAAAVMALLGELRDTLAILVIVLLNAAIGAVQEHRAERAMLALRRMTAADARVVRDGVTRTIPARELVPGDLVVLQAGDVVPADARLLDAPDLRVDESALTGESVPVDKQAEALPAGTTGELVTDRLDVVFKGTAVVHGRATAVVVATGMATEIGRIAGLLQTDRHPTPLQRRLAVLGRRLAAAALVVCVVVFLGGILRGEDAALMFLTAVSLAVAAIPEALPAVVTISLALGAQRMAEHRALIRKLPAVETLGSVTVICTDKTGTLTQGQMQVARVWTAAGEYVAVGSGYDPAGELHRDDRPVMVAEDPALAQLLQAAVLCNDAALQPPTTSDDRWQVAGDPTEGALLVLAARAGLDAAAVLAATPRVGEVPFDGRRKRMSTVHQLPDGGQLVASKGAVETILPLVAEVAGAPGDAAALERVREVAEAYAGAGYRVLAIAGTRRPASVGAASPDVEQQLTLHGLVALADGLRPAAREAVASCITAGILPVMITGDHPATARGIAEELGILDDREVLTGPELAAEGPAHLAEHVADVAVYARTTPEQKLDVVEAWQARGDVVAMTGDGVNDAPALRRADIGVAMGVAGSEVSKEAADLVLGDDDFATIVAAVREGRRIYDNIRRFVRYTLTSNSGEIWVMFLAPFLGLPLPLLPVQILWINLVTDGLPGLALGVEPAERDVMQRPPRSPLESVFARGLWQHVLVVGLLMGAVPLALAVWGQATGRPWQTMVFTSLALLQLGHALGVRSERDSLARLGLLTNRPLLATVAGTAALQLAVVYWGPAQTVLRTQPLSAGDLVVVLLASTVVFAAVELEKWVRRLGAPSAHRPPAGAPARR
jgi:P-type Ca2+ transporter type 2C